MHLEIGLADNFQGAFPARIREEMERDVAHRCKFLADTRLFGVAFRSLKRPVVE